MMRTVPSSQEHSHHPVLGIGLKLGSVLSLACMAACVKYLGPAIPAGQTIFFRGLVSMLVVAVVAWRTGGLGLLKTSNWRSHAARSVAGSLSMFCWFTTLTLIPLAEMTAISFTIPLFLTVLAMVFLGERIHAYRWTALAVGFLGVLTIVGPQLTEPGGSALGAGIGLAAAVLAAFALMFLRRMSNHEHALTITFYFFLTSTVLAAATAVLGNWPWPDTEQWVVIALTGAFGAVGQLLMSYSYRYAEASLVAPLDYLSLLVAIGLGYSLFGEVPHSATWIGAPLVIIAGGIILWREYGQLKRIRSAQRIAT